MIPLLFCQIGCYKSKNEVNQVLLCGLDRLLIDQEFRYYLIGGDNYIFYLPNGLSLNDSLTINNNRVAKDELYQPLLDSSFIEKLNERFPEGHKLKLVSQDENETLLRTVDDQPKSCWYFSGLRQYKNKYYFDGGFAVSPKLGIGASFTIEMINGKCKILEYNPSIY